MLDEYKVQLVVKGYNQIKGLIIRFICSGGKDNMGSNKSYNQSLKSNNWNLQQGFFRHNNHIIGDWGGGVADSVNAQWIIC